MVAALIHQPCVGCPETLATLSTLWPVPVASSHSFQLRFTKVGMGEYWHKSRGSKHSEVWVWTPIVKPRENDSVFLGLRSPSHLPSGPKSHRNAAYMR